MTVCVDYDNTIVSWDGTFVKGAQSALRKFKANGWTIFIYSGRYDLAEISKKLTTNDVPFDEIFHKPRADVYIDDRAVAFENDWDAVLLKAFKAAGERRQFDRWVKEQKEKRYEDKDEKEIQGM